MPPRKRSNWRQPTVFDDQAVGGRRTTRAARSSAERGRQPTKDGVTMNMSRSKEKAQKWVQVWRNPTGAGFTILQWVPLDKLTPQERHEYDLAHPTSLPPPSPQHENAVPNEPKDVTEVVPTVNAAMEPTENKTEEAPATQQPVPMDTTSTTSPEKLGASATAPVSEQNPETDVVPVPMDTSTPTKAEAGTDASQATSISATKEAATSQLGEPKEPLQLLSTAESPTGPSVAETPVQGSAGETSSTDAKTSGGPTMTTTADPSTTNTTTAAAPLDATPMTDNKDVQQGQDTATERKETNVSAETAPVDSSTEIDPTETEEPPAKKQRTQGEDGTSY